MRQSNSRVSGFFYPLARCGKYDGYKKNRLFPLRHLWRALLPCVCILLGINALSAQSLLKEFDSLFLTGTEEVSLTKVATYTDKKMFFLSAENLEFIPVFELKGEAIIKDSIPNVRIVTGRIGSIGQFPLL